MKQESLQQARQFWPLSATIQNVLDTLDPGPAVDVLARVPRIMTREALGDRGQEFAHSLCCIERGAMFMPPCEAVHGGLGALKREDALVMVSRGGKTAELLPVIDVCRKRGATLIAVTENLDSPLARAADIVLALHIGRESDKHNIMATSSFMATVALFDALLAALIEETGYEREMFALIHPGGAVGNLLNKEQAPC